MKERGAAEMGVPSERFREGRDVYYRYEWENVAFRWEHESGKTFRKFSGKPEVEIDRRSSKLDAEAQLGGEEITKAEYERF